MTDASDLDLLERFHHARDPGALDRFLARHRPGLRAVVAGRMGPRLAARVDPSDVVQEASLEAARRVPDYLRRPAVAPAAWLRALAVQALHQLARRHLLAGRRAVGREDAGADPAGVADHALTPARSAVRAEVGRGLTAALAELSPADRQVLVLRHLEQRTNLEAAAALGVSPTAACARHLRALKRLRAVLNRHPAAADGAEPGAR